jgi:hypothetical protein
MWRRPRSCGTQPTYSPTCLHPHRHQPQMVSVAREARPIPAIYSPVRSARSSKTGHCWRTREAVRTRPHRSTGVAVEAATVRA